MKVKYVTIITVVLLLLGNGCTPKPSRHPTAINNMQAGFKRDIRANQRIVATSKFTPPLAVKKALLPSMTFGTPMPQTVKPREKRFGISVQDVPANSFFMGLVEGTQYNMMVNPSITGTISLTLKNVTIPEVMEAVRDVYGYEYKKTATSYLVMPPKLQSRVFTVNYVNVSRSGSSHTSLGSGSSRGRSNYTGNNRTGGNTQGGEGSVNTTTKADFWGKLQGTITALIGVENGANNTENKQGYKKGNTISKGGKSVILNPQAGVIVVRAYPVELREVGKYLDTLQRNLTRQVILEAKILEVALNDKYDAGIDWHTLGLGQMMTESPNKFEVSPLKLRIGPISPNLDFQYIIELLQTQGNVQVLSSPHVATLNNQKAVIKSGEDEFFVTNAFGSVSQSTATNISTQNVALTSFFSGISLDVTPQISEQGEVILHIHPVVSRVSEREVSFTVGESGRAQSLPTAKTSIREADSIVKAKNGQIIIIGGLMQHKTTENVSSPPVLGKIPFIGALFRNTKQESVKSELVILLRPIVTDAATWTKQLERRSNRINNLNRGFHVGGKPDIFGTMAERNDF